MNKPRALDLFSGAGGATRGLQLAGYHVTGVDLHPQPRYCGDAFHQADAMTFPLEGFDLIWASPPCQRYSALASRHQDRTYPDLVAPIRGRLQQSGTPYIIENVPGAPLINPVLLCGTMFGLGCAGGELWRHRLFEVSWQSLMLTPPCRHQAAPIRCYGGGGLYSRMTPPKRVIGVYGHVGGAEGRRSQGAPRSVMAERKQAMGIDWMNRDELSQAIPPAYSRFIAEVSPALMERRAA